MTGVDPNNVGWGVDDTHDRQPADMDDGREARVAALVEKYKDVDWGGPRRKPEKGARQRVAERRKIVVEMVSRPGGATLDEIAVVTGSRYIYADLDGLDYVRTLASFRIACLPSCGVGRDVAAALHGKQWKTVQRLAAELGRSQVAVRKAMKRLEKYGVRIERRGTHYELAAQEVAA